MVLGVPREAAGVSFQCAQPASFALGRSTTAEPGDGVGRAALGAPGSPQCGVKFGGRRLRLVRLEGAGRRERKQRRWEAPTPGPRRLLRNFVVMSKGSEKKKHQRHAHPPARVSHAARRLRSGFIAECSAPRVCCRAGGRCLGPGAGAGPASACRSFGPRRQLRGSGPERGCHRVLTLSPGPRQVQGGQVSA